MWVGRSCDVWFWTASHLLSGAGSQIMINCFVSRADGHPDSENNRRALRLAEVNTGREVAAVAKTNEAKVASTSMATSLAGQTLPMRRAV